MAKGIVTSGDIDMTEPVLIGDAPTAFIVTLRTLASVSFLSNILSHNQSVLGCFPPSGVLYLVQ